MNVVFLGATKGIGRAVARTMAARGDRIALLGRDVEDLKRSAADLEALGGSVPATIACDLLDRATIEPAIASAWEALGKVDAVVVTAGLFGTQDALESDAELRDRVLTADFTNTVHVCEASATRLIGAGGGTLCVLSSVAGDRPRKTVYLYGAAKAGLSFYLEGLDLKYRDAGLRTLLVKPGFIKTAMTEGLPEPPFATGPEAIAPAIVRGIDRGTSVMYVPGIWRFVMFAVCSLPKFVMRKLNF
jgi:short-subunit dehydrogenase